jgi:hypothetical protein
VTRDFLAYWKPSTLELELAAGGPLNHAASNQYARVDIGDTVWIVTVVEGRLRLVGRLTVGSIVDQDGAIQALGKPNLWPADRHILPPRDAAHEVSNKDIHHLAQELRFVSAGGKDRLAFGADGSVNPQQLQTMRVLSPDSVALLREVVGQAV